MLNRKKIEEFKKTNPEILKKLPKWQQILHKIIRDSDKKN